MMASTSIPHRWKYDVFVSFRGEDIRKNFMDHLFKDFRQKGIHSFRDDNELLKGEEISPELYKAIEESRFLLVIFSKNYASSSWCLRELVKILQCKRINEQKHEVRIIFYDIKPNVVRKQTESYAQAFEKHGSSNRTEAAEWRKALSKAANLSGWDLQDMTNGYESKFIDNISKEILKILCHEQLHVGENIVGVDARVHKLDLFRFVGSDKVHMIGICGISGIGKTTLAKSIYNLMHTHFEGSCFCEDVQGKTLIQVQMQLIDSIMKTRDVQISNVSEGTMVVIQRISKPILLVLDDVDDRKQLEVLAGSHDWFSPGSLIIFTSKDKKLLRSHKVDPIYEMTFLDDDEAVQLFSLCAFGKENPSGELSEIAYDIVKHLQGHPLALKVLGGSLHNEPIDEWKSQLEELQRYPNKDIQEKLQPSFDRLDIHQRRILLDIACCFIGEKKDFVASVLDRYNNCAKTDIKALLDKSLITISQSDMSFQMHPLIRSMARKIILDESEMPGMRSRLWIPSEVCDALNESKVTEAVEVLVLLLDKCNQKVHIDGKAFSHMKNLRILKIYDLKLENFKHDGGLKLPKDFNVTCTGRLEFLSNKLNLLCWHGCPFKFLPSVFYPEYIVAIDLSYSHIKSLWTKPKCFRELKVMKLRHCHNLTSTPDFTEITNLEELYLDGCVNLGKVHTSIGMLKRLVVLSMRDCKRLKSFHCIFKTKSLQILDLSGCSKLDKFPEFDGTVKTLVELGVDRTNITELPSFVSSMTNLQVLSFAPNERIRSRQWTSTSWRSNSCFRSKLQHPQSLVVPSLESLCFLRKLNLRHCNILQVPDSIGGLSCLECLDLHGNNFTSLPGSLSQLPLLKRLVLDGCKKLEALPETPPRLSYVSADNCTSLQEVQAPLGKLDYTSIRYELKGCPKLFRNIIGIESKEVCISQPQDHDSCITSHGSRNTVSSFLHSCIRENFHAQEDDYIVVDIVLDGNRRIPKWFTLQSKGNHDVKVELPQSWCYDKFRGYGTCIVFTLKNHGSWEALEYAVTNANGASLEVVSMDIPIVSKKNRHIIWLHYTTDTWEWEEAKDFVTFSFKENEEYEVKESGVRLICDHEEEIDLIRMMEELPTPKIDGGGCFFIHERRQFHVSWYISS